MWEEALLIAPSLSVMGSLFIVYNIYLNYHGGTYTPRQALLLRLSVGDFWFSIFSITNVALTRFSFGKSWGACTIQGILMEFFASSTWLWSNVIALSHVFSEYRWEKRLKKLYGKTSHLTWLVAILFTIPALIFRSQAPSHKLCEPADTAYVIFTVELTVCFLFNVIAYAIASCHLQVYAPDSVRTRFSRRTSTYIWIFMGCWFVPFIVGIWYTFFDAKNLSDSIVNVALVTQSLQGAVNAIVYGMYENVWWRRRKQQHVAVEDEVEVEQQDDGENDNIDNEEKKERDTAKENLNSPLLMDYHVSFADPNLKDKDSRRWIHRQRMKIALRRAYGSQQENENTGNVVRSPSMRIV